jgi:aerobic carbon-monoxide dehydrogenase medium subunit
MRSSRLIEASVRFDTGFGSSLVYKKTTDGVQRGMKPAPFTYHPAHSIEQAVDLLARLGAEGGRVLAGGQSLVPLMAFRLAQPPHLIDINRVADFGALRVADDRLRIPATARHAAFTPDMAPPPLGPLLAKVARHIGHVPIRIRGTFCGSLSHADPAAEWPLVFVTLGGEAVARSRGRERVISAGDWFRGVMTTALAGNEMLVEARLELPPGDARLGFYEVSRRGGDYALAMALVSLRVVDGTVRAPRLGVGGAEPVPRRVEAAEAVLDGVAPEEAVFRRAADAAAEAVTPMEDVQVSAALRRDLVRTAVRRALRDALD